MTCVEKIRRAVCDDDPKYVNLHFTRQEFEVLIGQVERNEGAARGLLMLCEVLMDRPHEPPADDETCQEGTTVLGYVRD